MRILRNYILRETVAPFFLSLLTLTSILLLGNLIRLAEMVINKGVNLFSVSTLFFYLIPSLLPYTIPLACLSGVLLAFSRLSSDNELIAIRASGLNIFKVIAPILLVGIVLSLTLLLLHDVVIPYASYATRQIVKDIGTKNPAAALEAGRFITSFKNHILFIYRIEGNNLYNVRIYQPQGEDKPTRTIVAKRGEFVILPGENKIKLKLIDGISDEPDMKNPSNFYKLNFQYYFITLDLMKNEQKHVTKKPVDMSLQELYQEISSFESRSIETAPYATMLHRKIAMSFSVLIFILLGAPLAALVRRRERAANFGLAFVIFAFYYLFTIGFEALSLQLFLDPVLAMWLPNAIFGSIGLILLYKLCE
ncbi:LptF/LptG family permease [Candidatus Omnitrophota bacterium]